MAKKKRQLIILIVVLVLFVGAFVGIMLMNKSKENEKAAEAKAESESLKLSTLTDVAYVKIVNASGTMEYFNYGDRWVDVNDEEFPLDQSMLGDIKEAIVGLTATREIPMSDDLDSYGLGENSAPISVMAADGDKTIFNIQIGTEVADIGGYYAYIPETNLLYVIPIDLPEAVSYEWNDMMTKERFGEFAATDIVSITVTRGSRSATYMQEVKSETVPTGEVDEDTGEEITTTNYVSTWYDVTNGTNTPIENGSLQDAMASAAASFKFSMPDNYNVSDETLSNYGFASPMFTVTVTWKTTDGTENSRTLLLGKSTGEGTYWAKFEDSIIVNAIDTQSVNYFAQAAERLPADSEEIEQIENVDVDSDSAEE